MNMTDKEQARLKHKACELAAQIHDIVEERLWQDYRQLPNLCQRLIDNIEAVTQCAKSDASLEVRAQHLD